MMCSEWVEPWRQKVRWWSPGPGRKRNRELTAKCIWGFLLGSENVSELDRAGCTTL